MTRLKEQAIADLVFPLLVDKGLRQIDIAERLGVSTKTLHSQIRLVVAFYRARTLEQACVFWDRERLLTEQKPVLRRVGAR